MSRFHSRTSWHATPKSVEQVHACSDTIGRVAILRVHVVPNAKIDSVVGEYGGAIKIKLRAPAVEGKAKAALIRFLAERLKIPRHSIVLERGRTIARQTDSHRWLSRRRCEHSNAREMSEELSKSPEPRRSMKCRLPIINDRLRCGSAHSSPPKGGLAVTSCELSSFFAAVIFWLRHN